MAGTQNILLRKSELSDVDDLAPGEYIPYARSHPRYGDRAWVGWCCPRCEKSLLILRERHSVDYEGVVTPAINCAARDCDLSGHVVLADWVPEPMGCA